MLRKEVSLFLGLVLSSYITSCVVALFFPPASLANSLGFLALVSYAVTLLPGMLRVVFPSLKRNQTLIWILKYRRYIGVAAFAFGLNHGVLLILERQLNLLDFQTYIHYFQGFSLLTIFTILAITSNDWSVKRMKANWKKLHKLTYLAIFLLPWHMLDKMAGHWTHLTPICMAIVLVLIILFTQRKLNERAAHKSKPQPKITPQRV